MGVISPVGNSTESFFQNLVIGKPGTADSISFDTTDYKVKLAGEVKDFDPEAFGIDKGLARRCDTFTLYALAAAEQAMRQCWPEWRGSRPVGAAAWQRIGGMQTSESKLKAAHPRPVARVAVLRAWLRISAATLPLATSPSAMARRGRACRWSPPAPRPRTRLAKRSTPFSTAMPTPFWRAARRPPSCPWPWLGLHRTAALSE